MRERIWNGTRFGFVPLVFLTLAPLFAAAQEDTSLLGTPLRDYHNGSDYLPQTPSVTGGAVSAFFNPAAWVTGDRREFALWWNSQNLRDNAVDDWGLSFGRNLGFALNSDVYWDGATTRRVTDYQLGLAVGGRTGSVGLAYRWPSGDKEPIGRRSAFVLGAIARPSPYYTFGLAGAWANGSSAAQGIFDLGIRPLADDRLTFFGDFTLSNDEKLSDGRWGGGVDIRPVKGLHLGVKFRDADLIDDEEYRVTYSFGVVFGAASFHVLPSYTKGGERMHNDYLLRFNPSFPPLPVSAASLSRSPRYVAVSLENKRLTYQKFRYGDKQRVAWLDLARYLDAIAADGDVDGILLNLAGFATRPSLAWELRQKLQAMQDNGKELFVHGDRLDMLTYYLASVADHLSLDPQGELVLPGVALQRTYMKGTLEKVGIGFQEFRHFTHKSAMEVFSRDSMSEADREQRMRIVDVVYEALRTGVSEGRDLAHSQFDATIDDDVILTATTALNRGLVDQVTRWDDLSKWLNQEKGGKVGGGPNERYLRDYRERVWARLPAVAVVYTVGECAMDSGIKGRATSKHLESLARDRNVVAVVLRADSPGGDPLPSDLVAEGIRKLKAAGKPVIVSQGDVAASGGYWISMDGTRILTTPMTITGSIGVIGGWFWDDGLGEKLGLTTDGVQRGAHADLFAGMGLPFVGGSIPRRPLDDGELQQAEALIVELYDGFVQHVAVSRNLPEARIRELGEGRVWMGGDALENGLVDDFGTLQDAIAQAKELAGIAPDREIAVTEYPPRPLFDWGTFGPRLPGLTALESWTTSLKQPIAELLAAVSGDRNESLAAADSEDGLDYDRLYWQMLARNLGSPLLLTPPDLLPPAWLGRER